MRWSVRRSCGGEGVEDVGWSVAEAAVGAGDVGAAPEPNDVDRGVAQRGHDLWAVADAHAGVVLTLGDVANPVQAVLDRPVRADPAGEQPRIGIAVTQGSDRVDGLHRGFRLASAAAPADDLDRAGAVREQPGLRRSGQVDDLDRAGLGSAVAGVALALPGRLGPGQSGQGPAQPGLVAL